MSVCCLPFDSHLIMSSFGLILLLLFTRAYRQGVGILFTVCLFVFLFVQLRISPAWIKLAASNFARWFQGILSRGSPIFGNFAPPEAQNWTNWHAMSGCRIGMCG